MFECRRKPQGDNFFACVGIGTFEAAVEEFGIVRTATLEGIELLKLP